MVAPAAPVADTRKPASAPPVNANRANDSAAAVQRSASPGKPKPVRSGATEALARKAAADPNSRQPGSTASNTPSASQQRFDRMAVRAKLAVSQPGDALEREADQVAAQVARSPQPGASKPSAAPVSPAAQSIQREANIDSSPGVFVSEETEQGIEASRGQGAPLPPDLLTEMSQRLEHDFSTVRIHTDARAHALCTETQARAFTVGCDIYFAQGEFDPLSEAGRELLAHELTHVKQQSGAGRAPADDAMLHRKAKADGGEGTYRSGSGYIEFDTIAIPGNYATAYQAKVPLIRHRAFSGDTRPTRQQQIWRDTVAIANSVTKLNAVIAARPNSSGTTPTSYVFKLPSPNQQISGRSPRYVIGSSVAECARLASIPSWNRQGQKVGSSRATRITSYDVDHIVEAQLGSASESGRAFTMRPELDLKDNFQLLTDETNTAKMHAIKGAVRDKLDIFKESNSAVYRNKAFSEWNSEALLGRLSVKFLGTTSSDELATNDNDRWTLGDIEAGTHLQALIDASGPDIHGPEIQFLTVADIAVAPNHLWIFHSPSGGYKNDIDTTRANTWRNLLSPFEITQANFAPGVAGVLARFMVNVPASNTKLKRFANDKPVDIQSLGGSTSIGHFRMDRWRQIMELRRPDASAASSTPGAASEGLEATSFSPLTLDEIDVVPGTGLVIEGQILPSLPVIGDANIRYRVAGTDLSLYKTFTLSEITLPPPISLDACTLTISAGTRGFAANGRIDFGIERLGQGYLEGSIASRGGLALEGGFDFDRSLFDQASVRAWYRDAQFGAAGEIAITNPRKVRGIRSAALNVRYENGALSANGTIAPDIPGVQSASLRLNHNETDGLLIGGTLQLLANPAIRSGSVEVTGRKQDEAWHISARGSALPALPGITSLITVNYNDGAFDGEISAAYAQGIFSGNVRVGLTNRTPGPDGELPPAPAAGTAAGPAPSAAAVGPLSVYGSGNLTARITNTLQGTVGLRIRPGGELLISGSIGIPQPVQMFPQYPSPERARRTLFTMPTVSVPLLGVSAGSTVVGIALTIDGRITGHAHVGPGMLTETQLRVEDFNPARPDSLHITGDAEFNLPAQAGVGAQLDAGLSAGLAVIRATAGITASAEAVAQANITPHAHLDWRPATGLHLHGDLNSSLTPRLAFSVNGFAAVSSFGFNLWRQEWNLARRVLGSNLTLGVRVPVDYYSEGNRIEFNPENIRFTVPPLDRTLFEQLLSNAPPAATPETGPTEPSVPGASYGAPTVPMRDAEGRIINDIDQVCSPNERNFSSTDEALFTPASGFTPAAPSASRSSTRSASEATECVMPKVEPGQQAPEQLDEGLIERIGTGFPLDLATRSEFEQRMQSDFSQVQIHTSPEAAHEAMMLSAKAFTLGEHIAFADGEYRPETPEGKALLAHELTHVLQSRKGQSDIARSVAPAPTITPDVGHDQASIEQALSNVSVLNLPPVKHRHLALYRGVSPRRQAGFRRAIPSEDDQKRVWREGVILPEATMAQKLHARGALSNPAPPTNPNTPISFTVHGGEVISDRWRAMASRLQIPDWDREGNRLAGQQRFQVDHMVELQVYGDTTGEAGNILSNMELLKGDSNGASGREISGAITRTPGSISENVRAFLQANDAGFRAAADRDQQAQIRDFLRNHTITFERVDNSATGTRGRDNDWWTQEEIARGDPIDSTGPLPAGASRLRGDLGAKNFVLATGPGGIVMGRFHYAQLANFAPSGRLANAVPGLTINAFRLNDQAEVGTPDEPVGDMDCTWRLPGNFATPDTLTIPLKAIDQLCAYPDNIPSLSTQFTHLSPVSFPAVGLRDGKVYAEGSLTPSVPLLGDAPIQVILEGNDIRFQITYQAGSLTIPIPGLSIDDSSLSLFYSTQNGFGGGGAVDFSVAQLGSGYLAANITTGAGFGLEGSFNFDSDLFDRARVSAAYRDEAFSIEGEIGIDSPDKIRGIRAANLRVAYRDSQFSADGTVDPNIPGIRQAGLRVSHGEETGLVIGGNLELEENAAIRSGSIDVTVSKPEDRWIVAATGTAQPAIPGIDSTLTVAYDDGAFDASFEGSFERGMLSGTAEVGATNRTLDASGEPTGPAEPGAAIIVYGGGSATIQIAPWLQGTAGLRFAPNGECTVSGEIGLPDTLELFPRQEINRELFSLSTQIPIIPGVVAEVGGNLRATAGIGPGVLDEARIGIEYTPSHEENTHVTGDAHLNVPADAGLRLGARAGVGLGITGASATGGIELGGALGIAGAAEASVHVDWMPSQGLQIDAEAALHAAPRFRFDISGYVDVSVFGFSLYEETWELAAYEVGADYEFGIRFPLSYREGEPFSVSTDDIEFEVPEIDPASLIRQIGAEVF